MAGACNTRATPVNSGSVLLAPRLVTAHLPLRVDGKPAARSSPVIFVGFARPRIKPIEGLHQPFTRRTTTPPPAQQQVNPRPETSRECQTVDGPVAGHYSHRKTRVIHVARESLTIIARRRETWPVEDARHRCFPIEQGLRKTHVPPITAPRFQAVRISWLVNVCNWNGPVPRRTYPTIELRLSSLERRAVRLARGTFETPGKSGENSARIEGWAWDRRS